MSYCAQPLSEHQFAIHRLQIITTFTNAIIKNLSPVITNAQKNFTVSPTCLILSKNAVTHTLPVMTKAFIATEA